MALLKTNTGIGTTNPTSALHVIGDGLFTGIVTAASFSGPINAGVGTFTNLTATNATLTNINSSGISTLGVTSVTHLTAQSINSSGIVTGSTFRPSTGYIQAADGTNSFYIYNSTGNVAFQGTIGASQINNAQGYKVIGFAGTNNATFENNVYISGITTSVGGFVGNLTGTATTATKLENARTFEITGDVVATAISFDGTGNVSLAATIQPNSVGLGTDTTGDYVRDITGTANEIEVTGGTGEGSTPQIGLPDDVVITNNLYVGGITTSVGGFVGALTGIAASATKLVTPRTFEITGDVVATAISFDGTGNVSLAATIQPNSVGLGTDTTGDYVREIIGTANEITVTGGTGESSTPVVAIAINPTIPGNVTIGNDLQVNNNLNVNGNITVGGTTAYVIVEDFRLTDADIILGFTTDSYGNDVSTDTTANHGGIAVASTEGYPLVNLLIAGIETTPATYKKFMWFQAGSFAGLNTDAWLSNYAIGIGSTQFPSGTRLAAGAVQFTEDDLAVVRNINASGIITAASFSGNASSATNADYINISTETSNDSTYYIPFESGIGYTSLYVDTALTYNPGQDLLGLTNIQGTKISLYEGINASGVITATTFNGQVNAGVGTIISLIGTNLDYSGVSTLGSVSATQLNVSGIITGTLANDLILNTSGTGLSGSVTYNNSGVTTFTVTSNATDVNTPNTIVARDASGNFNAGIINANLVGIASTATQLLTPRDFSITGDFVTASAISFDGTGNVALAATITPNSIELGTYTSGNYVASITNGDYITGGDGGTEGAALTIGVAATSANTANQVVARDASGNFSAGTITANLTGTATTASFATTSYYLTDAENILNGTINPARLTGTYDIDINGNATTADYADVAGIATYATLSGIASYADVAGISTYSSLSGISSYADVAGISTYSSLSGISSYADVAGIATYAISAGIASYADVAGISTYSSLAGIASYADVAGISTNVIGGIASVTQLSVSGVSTISVNSSSDALRITQEGSGNALVVEDSTNPDASPFVVTSTGSVGIGTTNPTQKLQVYDGSVNVYKPTGEVQIQVESGDTSVAVFRAISPYRNWRFGIQGGANADFVIRDATSSANRLGITSAGEVIIGSNLTPLVPTGTASQLLQVTGGAYVSGSVGIGTTTPTSRLQVQGDTFISGILTAVNGIRGIGIQSGGVNITTGIITTLNFIGSAVSTITNTSGLVEINVKASQFTRTSSSFTATEGQTTFSVSYTPNYVDVFVNGVRLTSSEYTATNGSTIVLNDAAFAGDIIDVIAMQNDGLVDTSKWTATNTSNPISGNIYKESGNVGIGTTNPTAKLHVVGNSKIVGVVTATSFVGDGSLLTGIIAQGSGVQIKDDGTLVGTAATFNFINNINATVSSGVAEISISYVDNAGVSTDVIGGIGSITQLNVSGITTTVTLNVLDNSSSDAVRITQLGSGNALVVEDETNPDATPFVVTGIGSVGIGTTNPISKLHVTSEDSEVIRIERTNDNNALIQYTNIVGSMYAGLSPSATGWGVDSDNNLSTNPHLLVLRGGGEVLVGSGTSTGTASQKLQVTGGAYVSGFVGIGTTNPTAPLHISGADAANAKIKLEDNDNGFAASEINVANGGRDLRIAAPQDIYFEDLDTNTKTLYIKDGGNVGIGTDDPGAKLNVVDNSSSDALRITQLGSGNALVVEDSTNPDATRFVILPDGKVGVGTTGLIQYSSGVNDTSTFGILASTGNDSAFVLKGNNGSATDGSGQTLAILVGSSGGTGSGTIITHLSHDTSGIGTRRNAIRFTDSQIRFEDNVTGSVDVTINSSGSGELLVGRTSSTGTSNQLLQVEGGAYVSGSVGIGTTNPVTNLHVLVAAGSSLRLESGSNNVINEISLKTRSGRTARIVSSYTNSASTTETYLAFHTNVSGSQNDTVAESMRIAGGNVGIGTTNPTNKLEVYGDIGVGTSYNYRLNLQNSNAYNIGFNSTSALIWGLQTSGGITTTLTITGWGDGNAYIDNRNNGDIYFRNTGSLLSNSSSLVFKSGGTLLIGSATSTGTANQTLQVHSGGAYFNGSVGIGTTNPTAKLEPVDTAANPSVAPVVFIQRPNNIVPASIAPTNADLRIKSHSSNVKIYAEDHSANPLMILTGGGNLGIGTTNPQAKLHIEGGSTLAGGELNLIVRSSDSNNISATITQSSSASTLQIFSGGMAGGSSRGGQIDFVAGAATTDPGTLIFRTGTATGGTSQPERVRITSSGNVGIGTTNPTETLHVVGASNIANRTSYFSAPGDLFSFPGTENDIQFPGQNYEIITVGVASDIASNLNNKYFTIYGPGGTSSAIDVTAAEQNVVIWFNVAGAGSTPAVVGAGRSVGIAITSGASAISVGNSITTQMSSDAGFTVATSGDGNVVFVPKTPQNFSAPTVGTAGTVGFAVTTTQDGSGSLSGTTKWIGGVLAPNGKIYGIPYSSTSVLVIDPAVGTATTFGSLSGSSKWNGGVLAPNGKIYGIPSNSTSVLVIDPATNTTSTFGSLSGSNKWFGGVLAPNGKIYGIPYDSTSVLVIDPATNTTSTFGSLSGTGKWFGGVLAPNGKIYGIPRNSTSVLVIDPAVGTATTFGSLSGSSKWNGGVLAPNGKIYGIPYFSTSVLSIGGGSAAIPDWYLSAYQNKL